MEPLYSKKIIIILGIETGLSLNTGNPKGVFSLWFSKSHYCVLLKFTYPVLLKVPWHIAGT